MSGLDKALKTGRLNLLASVALLAVGIALYLGGEQLSGFGRVTLQGLGSLIAVAITGGFMYDVFLRDVHQNQTMANVKDQLAEALESALAESSVSESLARLAQLDAARPTELDAMLRAAFRTEYATQLDRLLPGALRHGFAGVVDRMRFDDLFRSLQETDELLWLDTYCPDQPQFEQPMREAVQRGAKVRMLAMSPKSKLMPLRATEIDEALEIGYSAHDFAGSARRALSGMVGLIETIRREPSRGSIILRTYDDLPCLPMYLILRNGRADEGYTSFFLTRPTYHEPHLRWVAAADSRLECFAAYFERKWRFALASELASAGSA